MSNEPKDLQVEISPEVEEQIANDPELAEALKSFLAAMHQANHAVQTGKHASLEDAMEAITGHRPMPVDLEDLDD